MGGRLLFGANVATCGGCPRRKRRGFRRCGVPRMSVLKRIAFFQNRRDEVPNLELAKDLAERGDRESIGEIVHNLHHENANVRSDCLKVLYEIGYLRPELIADYVGEFLALVGDKHNRMVWGGMIALSTIAGIRAGEID